MNFLELASERYTTKKYNPSRKIEQSVIEDLKKVLQLTPSSINSQPWKFIVVSDEGMKNKLAEVSYFNEQKIKDASHLVVFCTLSSKQNLEAQINANLPEGSINYYKQFLQPHSEEGIVFWMQHQVYLSLGWFLSACAAYHIDSTPMEGVKNTEYDRILELDGYSTVFAVALGYRDETDANQLQFKPKTRLPFDTVVEEI